MHTTAKMRRISASLIITLTLSLSALGNIYANSPLASTVWTAGHSEKIAWMDDKSSPKLSKLGPVDIQLYSGDGASCFIALCTLLLC